MCIDSSGTRYSIEQMEMIDEARQLVADDQIIHIIADPRHTHEEMRELMLCALSGRDIPDDATAGQRTEIMRDDRTRVQARAAEIQEARRLNSKARNISDRARAL